MQSALMYRSWGLCSHVIPGFLAGTAPGGGEDVFHLHPVTSLSLKSDDLNFVQNYFG